MGFVCGATDVLSGCFGVAKRDVEATDLGAVLGPVADVLLQLLMFHPHLDALLSGERFFQLRTALFALGGAVVIGFLGLLIALAIAFLKRPKTRTLIQA